MKDKYTLHRIVVGPIMENCYILRNEDTMEMLVVDPGDEPERIIKEIESLGGELKAILLTHGHHDHFTALRLVRDKYPDAKYYACFDEEWLLNHRSDYFGKAPMEMLGTPDVWVKEGDEIDLMGTNIKVLQTPGHTRGSVCYYLPEEKILFTGDTVFKCSCGRTDLVTGDGNEMLSSLRRIAKDIPDDVAIYPGHEDSSTMEFEKKYNPYFRM